MVDKLFEEYDKNKNGLLELSEVVEMVNKTLKNSNFGQKFSFADAR